MQREIHAELKQRAASMSRMAKRWSAQNRTSESLWRSDAITYLGDFAGYLNFTYVDSNFVNRWIEPKDKEKDFRDFDFKKSRRAHKNLDSTKRTEISKTHILPHGEAVFVEAHPVYSAAGHDGFIYTLVDYDAFFKSILNHAGFSVEISEDGHTIYKKSINELDIDMLRSWSAAIQVLVAEDIVWNVSLIPSAAILREYSSNIPRFVLIIGCLLAIFISVIIHGNAELKKTREVAIASSASKAQFLANMSHEIRTPLNGVIGMAGLLQTTELSPIQNEYISYLKDSGHILLNLINDILDFSKIEAGKLQLENIDFNLEQNIDFVISNLSQAAESKKLKLRTEYAQPIPHWLVGDPSRFKQILINLVSNAIKFTSVGEVVVRTLILEQTDTHLNFKVSVTDTGIGILPESIEKLFQSFSQADSSIRRKFGGTGLGLAISQSLVHTMNGQIGVHSEPDKGSTFWFTLKLPIGKEVLDVEPESYIAPASLTKRRILVAEDNTINQKVIDAILRKLGYECQVVANGLEVLSLIENVKFDLILMDCQMPELDGLETTRLIRSSSNKFNKIIPIVALTANAMKGDRESCMAAGMNDYLTKPIVTTELAEVLNRLLKD